VDQTHTEIEELSIRTPRPVAMTEWPTSRWPKASGGCHQLCASTKLFQTQLCRGIIDFYKETQRLGVVKAHYLVKRAAGWCNAVQ